MTTFFSKLFNTTATKAAKRTSEDPDHAAVISRTAQMTHSDKARSLAKKHGLEILDLTWEDTGRFKGSCVGPNISDMTIQVAQEKAVTCMPVIRYPNFSDKTADISIDDVVLRVGNEKGNTLQNVTLRDYLRGLRKHLSKPDSWGGKETSLLAPREKEVLVSAQACFLPVPKSGKAEFNPVLFNYQSYAGAPAVLAIVATREGTSATIIDNQRDGFGAGAAWGQRLFFNHDGERASFTGTRMTEFVAEGGDATDRVDTMEAAAAKGLNCVMLIQVPLVQPQMPRRAAMMPPCAAMGAPAFDECTRSRAMDDEEGDVDEAVIGHGDVEGPFTEIDGLAIKRDARFPIRVTVQFYKATSNGVVTAADINAIASQIEAVYRDAKAVGSLVTEPDKGRSTEWDDGGNGKKEPADWWQTFWATQEAATGKPRQELLRQLEVLLGRRPTESELESAIKRVFGG
ncbi:MAG TPA: hypothetical protein VL326_28825 [Kofleriaceae bacterium]|nr:hypothetical protein [Kofleriaceae bacterium]